MDNCWGKKRLERVFCMCHDVALSGYTHVWLQPAITEQIIAAPWMGVWNSYLSYSYYTHKNADSEGRNSYKYYRR